MDKTVTAKIPTKNQLNIAGAVDMQMCAIIDTGFSYWTSTPYSNSQSWAAYCDDGYHGYLANFDIVNGNGAVPLAIITP